MEDFEVMRNLTFGQYLPVESPIHRLDPRSKLLSTGFLLVALIVSRELAALLLAFFILLGLAALARVPVGYLLKPLHAAWPFILLIVLLQLATFPGLPEAGCDTLWQWWILHITTCSVRIAALTLGRIIVLLLLINLLALSTSLNEVIHGTEHLLRPLGRIGLPANELALVLAIALRFVPLLGRETERIMKAQAARGADFGRGRWGFVQRVKRLLPLLIPLFITSLERAEDLAVAMESRCYGGSKGRSHWVQLQANSADYCALFLAVIVSAILVISPW